MSLLSRITDVHCHVIDSKEWVDRILSSQQEKIIFQTKAVCLMSAQQEDFHLAASLSKKFPERFIPAFGIHPWFVHKLPQDPENSWLVEMEKMLIECPGSIVGEIGT